MLSKLTTSAQARQWPGHIPVEYVYTAGIAGEAFLRALKDRGMLLTSRCPQCQTVYLPARLYCEQCFEETKQYEEVEPKGWVHTYTVAHVDIDGEALAVPQIYAFIRFGGTNGGLIHRLGQTEPHQVSIGMEVEALLLPGKERTGSINDITCFQPTK